MTESASAPQDPIPAHQYENIEVTLDYPVATLRFNRPGSLNAMSQGLQKDVIVALDQLEADENVRSVILCGAGRAFSAGYDIGGGQGANRDNVGVMDRKRTMQGSRRYAERVWNFRKPIVAAVHGYCLGGACEIAMLADLTVASDDCKFGEPEIRFSTTSTLVMPWIVPMKIARELLYTGKFIDAKRAYEIGMVNDVVPAEDLMRRANYHARLISKMAPAGIEIMKEGLNRTYEIMGLLSALDYHDTLTAILYGTETEEYAEFKKISTESGLRAALDWRDRQFKEVEELA